MENDSRHKRTREKYLTFLFSLEGKNAFFQQIRIWASKLSEADQIRLLNHWNDLENSELDEIIKATKKPNK